jgi:hypothetical protein
MLRNNKVRRMNSSQEKIDRIRELLDELSDDQMNSDGREFLQNFDSLELPNLISTIIDHLQPELKGYEAAIYWHLFRKSILATGQQYVRVSVRCMQEGVIKSSSGQSDSLSYSAVQYALAMLEKLGAVQKAGETNRELTLHKVCLTEEIGVCQRLIKEAISGRALHEYVSRDRIRPSELPDANPTTVIPLLCVAPLASNFICKSIAICRFPPFSCVDGTQSRISRRGNRQARIEYNHPNA